MAMPKRAGDGSHAEGDEENMSKVSSNNVFLSAGGLQRGMKLLLGSRKSAKYEFERKYPSCAAP